MIVARVPAPLNCVGEISVLPIKFALFATKRLLLMLLIKFTVQGYAKIEHGVNIRTLNLQVAALAVDMLTL